MPPLQHEGHRQNYLSSSNLSSANNQPRKGRIGASPQKAERQDTTTEPYFGSNGSTHSQQSLDAEKRTKESLQHPTVHSNEMLYGRHAEEEVLHHKVEELAAHRYLTSGSIDPPRPHTVQRGHIRDRDHVSPEKKKPIKRNKQEIFEETYHRTTEPAAPRPANLNLPPPSSTPLKLQEKVYDNIKVIAPEIKSNPRPPTSYGSRESVNLSSRGSLSIQRYLAQSSEDFGSDSPDSRDYTVPVLPHESYAIKNWYDDDEIDGNTDIEENREEKEEDVLAEYDRKYQEIKMEAHRSQRSVHTPSHPTNPKTASIAHVSSMVQPGDRAIEEVPPDVLSYAGHCCNFKVAVGSFFIVIVVGIIIW